MTENQLPPSSERSNYQYRVVNLGSFDTATRLQRVLAESGRDGWELVSVYDKASNWIASFEKGFILFKRPVAAGVKLPLDQWCELFSVVSGETTKSTSLGVAGVPLD